MVYERLFFEVVIVMVKHKKNSIEDTISIKIYFMHYMSWTRVMLPVVFEEFEMVYMFYYTFFLLTIIFNWKKVHYSKKPPLPHPVSADLYDFNSERGYGVLKSKSPFFLLNKNKNFNKTRRIENGKFRAYF